MRQLFECGNYKIKYFFCNQLLLFSVLQDFKNMFIKSKHISITKHFCKKHHQSTVERCVIRRVLIIGRVGGSSGRFRGRSVIDVVRGVKLRAPGLTGPVRFEEMDGIILRAVGK